MTLVAVAALAVPLTTGIRADGNGYVPLIRMNDVEYSNGTYVGLRDAPVPQGQRIGVVACDLTGPPRHCPRGAVAATLPVGTPLYAVAGYATSFRIGFEWSDGTREIYEVSSNPVARFGAELLDVLGKVEWLTVTRRLSSGEQRASIFDAAILNEMAQLIARAPARPGSLPRDLRDVYVLDFRFFDGTGTLRRLDPTLRILEPGVAVPDRFVEMLNAALAG